MSVRWLVALPSCSSPAPTTLDGLRLYVPAGRLMVFGLPAVLAVLSAASRASRKLILPSAPGLLLNAVRLVVLPSTTSLVVETVTEPAAYTGRAGKLNAKPSEITN